MPNANAPKLLWIGDAVVSTGFSRCTHAVCDYLHSLGWDVAVLGLNYYGDPHKYAYPVYPAFQPLDGGADFAGVGRVENLVRQLSPDVVVILNDPWNLGPYISQVRKTNPAIPILPWVAIDSNNVRMPQGDCAVSDVAVWTEFAAQELQRGGFEGTIHTVPLAFDHITPVSCSRAESRALWGCDLPDDAFVFGYVGRNQPRKRVDLLLRCFAKFADQYRADNAYLYLHSAPTGETAANLGLLIKYYGLEGKVLHANAGLGAGFPDTHLSHCYNALDVFITLSQAEGWCLPVGEAMLCDRACIVPDNSALGKSGGWVGNGAMQVRCSGSALTAPMNAQAYTIGGVVDETAAVGAMAHMMIDSELRMEYAKRGKAVAQTFTWDAAAKKMLTVLQALLSRKAEV